MTIAKGVLAKAKSGSESVTMSSSLDVSQYILELSRQSLEEQGDDEPKKAKEADQAAIDIDRPFVSAREALDVGRFVEAEYERSEGLLHRYPPPSFHWARLSTLTWAQCFCSFLALVTLDTKVKADVYRDAAVLNAALIIGVLGIMAARWRSVTWLLAFGFLEGCAIIWPLFASFDRIEDILNLVFPISFGWEKFPPRWVLSKAAWLGVELCGAFACAEVAAGIERLLSHNSHSIQSSNLLEKEHRARVVALETERRLQELEFRKRLGAGVITAQAVVSRNLSQCGLA